MRMASNTFAALLASGLLLAGCSKAEQATPESLSVEETAADAPPQKEFGFREATRGPALMPDRQAEAKEEAQEAAGNASQPLSAEGTPQTSQPAAAPRIAYAYSFAFEVPGTNLARLQQSHADLCDRMGPQSCRVMKMSQSDGDERYGYGDLQLEVAAGKAKDFGTRLDQAAKELGGERTSSGVSGEDLGRRIVDTEAKLRSRILLRDRLMQLLATRQGTVAELVAAERAVAEVNEEIDATQSNLAELTGRVEFSRVELSYTAEGSASGDFIGPIADVLDNLPAVLGVTIAVLIVLTIVLGPIAGIAWLIVRSVRRSRRRAAEVAASAATVAADA